MFYNVGWAAVLANMEDTTQSFRNRAEQFEQSFSHYLEMKAEYVQLLDK